MFNSIHGNLTYKGSDFIRIEAFGIEWEMSVPSRSVDSFGNIGDETRALCWLLHKEDTMKLFGFSSEHERAIFLELITVNGIGPKQANKILGSIAPTEFGDALENEDLAKLESIPGLGKKTAQKLVFSLKGKLPSKIAIADSKNGGKYGEIVKILVDMGYDRKRATDAVNNAANSGSLPEKASEKESELVRRAIIEMSS